MTPFLDVRLAPVGGNLATSVATNQGTDIGNYTSLAKASLLAGIQGRHVLIATHGFNVDRANGIASLSHWGDCFNPIPRLLPLPRLFLSACCGRGTPSRLTVSSIPKSPGSPTKRPT